MKEPGEIEAMRAAAAVVDRALERVLEGGIVGRTERDVAFALDGAMLRGGRRGAQLPHDRGAPGPMARGRTTFPGPTPIPPDTLVIIDLGAVVDGYCSDMTRTVATGPLPARLERDLRGLPRRPGGGGRGRRAAGMTAAELDAVARTRIAEAGLR